MAKRKAKADAEASEEQNVADLQKQAVMAKKRSIMGGSTPGADEPTTDEKVAAEKVKVHKEGTVPPPKPKTKAEAAVEKKQNELEITDSETKEAREVEAKDALSKAVAKAGAE